MAQVSPLALCLCSWTINAKAMVLHWHTIIEWEYMWQKEEEMIKMMKQMKEQQERRKKKMENRMSLEETILKLQEKLLFLQEKQQQQQLSLQLRKVLHEEGKQNDPTTLTSAAEPDC